MWTDELNPWGAYDGSPHLAKRCWCTGETPNMVRRQRRFGTNEELVPEADEGQSALEAELLLAINRTMAALRPMAVVHRVRLDSSALALEIDDRALDSVLANALPLLVGDAVVGIAGLRAVPARDHLDLRLDDGSGEVRLLGVTRQRWRDAVDALPGTPVWNRRRLRSARYSVRLMSGVLRRLPLWKGAARVDVVPGRQTVDIYWRGGPSGWSVAQILGGSCAGLRGVAATAQSLNHAVRGVSLAVDATTRKEEPELAWQDLLLATTTEVERRRFLRHAVAITVGTGGHRA